MFTPSSDVKDHKHSEGNSYENARNRNSNCNGDACKTYSYALSIIQYYFDGCEHTSIFRTDNSYFKTSIIFSMFNHIF